LLHDLTPHISLQSTFNLILIQTGAQANLFYRIAPIGKGAQPPVSQAMCRMPGIQKSLFLLGF
jgi:hypothetical protein